MITNSLHKNILLPGAFDILHSINLNSNFDNFYLAGGTSLALQIGHRQSIDLDFFAPVEFKSSLVHAIGKEYEVMSMFDNSIELIIDGVKVMFFFFAFPLFRPLVEVERIRLADPVDVGLMKLLALQGRTTRKDIIDLYFIDKEIIHLEELLDLFERFYPSSSYNSYSSLKVLLDEKQLSDQPMPMMMKECEWESCFKYVGKKIGKHMKKQVGI